MANIVTYPMTSDSSAETFTFQAEINQLLSLIINTFYSNKDIFLRELISNASDALDKYRHTVLTENKTVPNDLSIRIRFSPSEKTLVIEDNGIGMNKTELVNNLGTIARSGTKAFMEAVSSGQNLVSLIGQFGVGFYSSYLVADKVSVTSRRDDSEEAYIWESEASGTFVVRQASNAEMKGLSRGTVITLSMKEDQCEYLAETKLRDLVKKHCGYISYPVQLYTEKQVEEDDDDASETEAKNQEEEDEKEGNVEEVVQEDAAPSQAKEKKFVTKSDWITLNQVKPVWLRPPDEVTHDEYASFYRSLANDWEDHLAVKHFTVEGQLEFKSVLFIPRRAPFDMFNGQTKPRNIKLYVRRVFIMDDCEELMPEYLSFIKGIVDSEDLPLNISREMLQQNKIMRVIRKNVVKKAVDMMTDLKDTKLEEYKTFYEHFSKNIKLGVHEDDQNRDKLAELLMFGSTHSNAGLVFLKDYVYRMKEGQKHIYYITGESRTAVEHSPFIEKLRTKNYEVLFLTDAIDEYMMNALKTYDGKQFVNCTKDGLEIETDDESSKEQKEAVRKEFEDVCKCIKDILADEVNKVVVSERVVTSPCVLVTDKFAWSANMERIMKAQALNHSMMFGGNTKRTMEINPEHPMILEIKKRTAEGNQQTVVKKIVEIMFSLALLDSGYQLPDPNAFTKKMYKLIQVGMNIVADEEEEEDESKETTDAALDNASDAKSETIALEEVD
jgi:molecular chaperone HtpG